MWPQLRRRSFTLAELLIVIAIIGVLAASLLSALFTVMEDAREARTRAQIARLNDLIMGKWESYKTRALSINIGPIATFPIGPEPFTDTNWNGIWDSGESYTDRNSNGSYDPGCVSLFRLLALHDLMRLELPDRMTDLSDTPIEPSYPLAYAPGTLWNSGTVPPLWRAYRRRAGITSAIPPVTSWPASTALPASANATYEGAECLYLIVSQMRYGDAPALDYFAPTEIGDKDGDGLKEIWDAWGNPIEFIRWPAGFATQPGEDGAWGKAGFDDDGDGAIDNITEIGAIGSDDSSEIMNRNPGNAPDPFNPFGAAPSGFSIFPLIYSAGSDGIYDIFSETNVAAGDAPIRYMTFPAASRALPDNPYLIWTNASGTISKQVGKPGGVNSQDNISNHSLTGAAL